MKIRRALTLVGALLCAVGACSGVAQAMDISVVGSQVIASGSVDAVDEPRLALALSAPGLSELVLVDAIGGDVNAGLAMGRLVAAKRLRTVVVGSCEGACALVFLGGKERRFAQGQHPSKTRLVFTALSSNARADALPSDSFLRDALAFARRQIDAKFSTDFLRPVFASQASARKSLWLAEPGRNAVTQRQAQLCADAAGLVPPDKSCDTLTDQDAASLGVITAQATLPAVLPPDFAPAAVFFGLTLKASATDARDALLKQAQAMCAQDGVCNERFAAALPKFVQQKSFRAVALGQGKRGFGFSDDQPSPEAAVKRAIFLCNHTPNNKKLCSAAGVDDFDLSPLYRQSALDAARALSDLTVPAALGAVPSAVPSAGLSAPLALLRGKPTAATPVVVDQLKNWDTPDLALAVKDKRVTVIDVGGSASQMLPGAVFLWDAGLAFDDEATDLAFGLRFKDMLSLVNPDLQRPVVFYCQGAHCSGAINAAVRAVQAGYTQVGWYRGGLDSWVQAKLPTVQKLPLAVLY